MSLLLHIMLRLHFVEGDQTRGSKIREIYCTSMRVMKYVANQATGNELLTNMLVSVLDCLISYLSNCSFSVLLGDASSSHAPLFCGVPRGLSCVPFNLSC